MRYPAPHSIRTRVRASLAAVASLALVTSGLLLGAAPAGAAVPADDATKAIITVKTGGVRTDTNTVGSLAGVKLELVRDDNGNSQGSPTGSPVATCESDADGDCSFEVAAALLNTTANRQFWIRQASSFVAGSEAETNYGPNTSLVTGLNISNYQDTAYRFYISNVQADHTYVSGVDFMQLTDGVRSASSGIWQNSYDNPAAQATCGLNIALVSDLSSSVGSTELAQLKAAATGFVQALNGTPSTISLYTFGTTAPAPNTTGTNNATLLNKSTLVPADVTALTSKIAGYAVPSGSYTNWDAGLWQLRNGGYDQIIVITDGNPTAFSTNTTTSGVDTRFNEIERAVFSANSLKAAGSRIVTVGIGNTMLDGQNLKAISGTVANSDYFTGDWSDLVDTLGAIATENCAGSVTIVKKVIPWNGTIANATAAGGWVFDASAGPAGVTLDHAQGTTDVVNGAVNFQLTDVPVGGATFTAAEQLQGGYTLTQQGGKNAVCSTSSGSSVTVTNGSGTSFSVPVGATDIVSCTVYNKQPQPGATLTVNKQWIINSVAQPLNTFPDGFEAQLTGSATTWGSSTQVSAGAASIGESGVVVPGQYCTLATQKVTSFNGQPVDVNIASTPYNPTLVAGTDNTATITNSVSCVGLLKLVKVVVNDNGGTATSAEWTLKYGATGVASGTTSPVTAGVGYALTEVGPAGYAPSATDPLVCTSGLSGTTVTVAAMTTVTCTFTNDDIAPTLTLVKKVAGAPAIGADNWTLTAKDGGQVVVSGAGSTAATPVDAGVNYTLAETAGPGVNGDDFTASTWSCLAGDTPVAVTAGVLDKLQLGQDVVCTITNTANGVDAQITKTAAPAVQNPDGTWTIVYTVTVTNPSPYSGITYDLSDTLDFGGSISVVSSGATLGGNPVAGWNGTTTTALADGVALAADSSDVYTVTVVASVPDGETATQCPVTSGEGGFLNHALLTVGDDTFPADACVAPSKPSLQKTAGTVTSNADGTFTVTYDLTVTNTSAATLYYDLSDDPQATFPSGVEVLSGTVTPAADYPGFTSSFNPVASQNPQIVDGLALPGGSVDSPSVQSFTVSLVVGVGTGVEASALDCTADDGGLTNVATLVSGNQTVTDDACATITRPTVSHTKTLVSADQNADGTWTIVYDVDVTATGDGTTTYDLADQPQFGDGIAVVSGSATGPAQASVWDGDATTALATAEPIAGGETDSYVITIVASVDAASLGTDADDCTLDQGETGTGFLNVASLTANGETTTDDACASPAVPTLDKSWISTEQNADASWNVTFEVTVDNGGSASDLYYDLSDVPGFLPDATITAATVALNGASAAPWNGSTALATGRLLPGDTPDTDSKDSYVIVFTVTLPLDVDEATLECSEEGAGHGYYNSVTLTSGDTTVTDADCGTVKEGVLPTITKQVKAGYPKQVAGGNWEIAYEITVATPAETTLNARYDLSDTLDFGDGFEVLDAAITGPGLATPNAWNGQSVTSVATGVTLPAGETHVYTVLVTARIDQGVVGTDAADCEVTGDESGTGFRNTALLTSGGLERTAEACDEPGAPTVTKDIVGSPVKGSGGKVTITYTVTASNLSDVEVNYDLDDALGFAEWVAISSATVTSSDAPTDASWNGLANTRVVTGQPLPAGASDVFTVVVVATPTLFVEEQNLACVPATPGKGYFNGAVLTSGADTYKDDACAPIPKTDLPTLPLPPDLPTLALTGLTVAGGGLAAGVALLLGGMVLLVVRRVRRSSAG